MKRICTAMGIAGALALSGFAASATTTDPSKQLIHFDELGSNAVLDEYFDPAKNFLIDGLKLDKTTNTYIDGTVNPQSGNCAPSTNGGNGNCIIEARQAEKYVLTHDSGASGSIPNYNNGATDSFDFLGFYFELTGNGGSCQGITGGIASCDNFVTVEAWDDTGATPSLLNSITWYAGLANNISYLTLAPNGDAIPAGSVVQWSNQGYYANLAGVAGFDDASTLTRIVFQSGSDAQIRYDCIIVEADISTNPSPYDPNTPCGLTGVVNPPPPPGIPLPAAGWLMVAGLGGLAALRRKKK